MHNKLGVVDVKTFQSHWSVLLEMNLILDNLINCVHLVLFQPSTVNTTTKVCMSVLQYLLRVTLYLQVGCWSSCILNSVEQHMVTTLT